MVIILVRTLKIKVYNLRVLDIIIFLLKIFDSVRKILTDSIYNHMHCFTWGYSSSGRAAALQAVGGRFESD